MKDSSDSAAVGRALEPEGYSQRKLIRPSLPRSEGASGERRDRPARKAAPPEQTNAENFYFQKQMQARTPMVVVLRDGEEIHGTIEWYDKNCIKLNRAGEPNLLIYKPSIKYLYKAAEGGNGRR
jgi:host factor-I protein